MNGQPVSEYHAVDHILGDRIPDPIEISALNEFKEYDFDVLMKRMDELLMEM